MKRLWSGDLTNARIAAELTALKPGLILAPNQSAELPYQNLLLAEYRMVYQDQDHQLYVLKSVIKQAALSPSPSALRQIKESRLIKPSKSKKKYFRERRRNLAPAPASSPAGCGRQLRSQGVPSRAGAFL